MRLKNTSIFAALLLASLAGTGCTTTNTASAKAKQAKALRVESTFAQAQAYDAAGDTTKAAAAYRKTLSAQPEHAGALGRLAPILTGDRKFPEAIPLWKRYVEATHGSADALNDLGYCYDLAGYADPAEAAYLRAIRANPSHTRARANYGLMLARHGRVNEAMLHLRTAMSETDAHYHVAVILERQGKVSRARKEFEKALDLDPTNVDAELHIAGIDFNE